MTYIWFLIVGLSSMYIGNLNHYQNHVMSLSNATIPGNRRTSLIICFILFGFTFKFFALQVYLPKVKYIVYILSRKQMLFMNLYRRVLQYKFFLHLSRIWYILVCIDFLQVIKFSSVSKQRGVTNLAPTWTGKAG